MILIDILGKMGGAERNLILLAEYLRARGHKIIVCCLKGGELARGMRQKGFDVKVLNIRRIYDHKGIKALLKMIKLVKAKKVSVLMTYHESSDFMGFLIAVLTNTPVISSRRDMGFKLAPRHIKVYKIINRFFDHIVTVSSAVMQVIIKSQGARSGKISVIPNGVEPIKTQGGKPWKGAKGFEVESESMNVCCLANIRPIKGQKFLVSAAQLVVRKFPQVRFFFVGATDIDKAYYGELQEQIKKLGLTGIVHFLGEIPSSHVPGLIDEMDICVLPSLSEGMSNTLLEYMAVGKPVVATTVGGNPELIEDGKTGYLVPPQNSKSLADALLKLLNNSELRNQMGLRARERVEREFSVIRMGERYEDLLQSIHKKKIEPRSEIC